MTQREESPAGRPQTFALKRRYLGKLAERGLLWLLAMTADLFVAVVLLSVLRRAGNSIIEIVLCATVVVGVVAAANAVASFVRCISCLRKTPNYISIDGESITFDGENIPFSSMTGVTVTSRLRRDGGIRIIKLSAGRRYVYALGFVSDHAEEGSVLAHDDYCKIVSAIRVGLADRPGVFASDVIINTRARDE